MIVLSRDGDAAGSTNVDCPPLRWGRVSSMNAGGELEVNTELGDHVRPDAEAVVIKHGSRRCHYRRGRNRCK
jgi:hypothetical protein